MRCGFERKRSAVRHLHGVSRPAATKPNICRTCRCSGDGIASKSVCLTRGGLLGSAKTVGRTTQGGKPMAQQIKDRPAVREGCQKAVPTVLCKERGGKVSTAKVVRGSDRIMSNQGSQPRMGVTVDAADSILSATEIRDADGRQQPFSRLSAAFNYLSMRAAMCLTQDKSGCCPVYDGTNGS